MRLPSGNQAKASTPVATLAQASRLAAIGGDDVELRLAVLAALLFALGHEGDQVAFG